MEAKMETGVVEVLSEGREEHKSSHHYAQTALFTMCRYYRVLANSPQQQPGLRKNEH